MTEKEPSKVPSLRMDAGKILVDTIDVPLEVDGETKSVKMRKITAGEKQELIKKTASVKVVGTQQTGTMDAVGYQIGLLADVIVEAPFPHTLNDLRNLPDEITEYLFEEYSAFSNGKKKD